MKKSLENERKSLEAERDAPVPIARKPLPATPFSNYPPSHRPLTPPKSYPHFQPPAPGNGPNTQVARQIARGQHIRFSSDGGGTASVVRKPVGPRPLHTRIQTEDAALPQRKPVGGLPWHDENVSPVEYDARRNVHNSSDQDKLNAEQQLHITLIRRDPSSSSQWNIGSLTREKGSMGAHQNTFKIELTTPGYQKFAKQVGFESLSLSDFQNGTAPPASTTSPATPASTSSTSPFTREVRLTQPRSALLPLRRGSEDIQPSLPSPTKVSMRNHHFTFSSPWQGTCVFTTATNGRSLKCRHTIPTSTLSETGETLTVAELKFNLPWTVLRSRDANSKVGAHSKSPSLSTIVGPDRTEALKRSVQKIKDKGLNRDSWGRRGYDSEPLSSSSARRQNTQSDSDLGSDFEEGRLDLTLGREKAGGGRKGKNAKLGKLVIEDEGLKMCDLVVAACMGVWWQHYARMDER